MATYVLCHGGWVGGWQWRVAAPSGGGQGILATFPLPLSEAEQTRLAASAQVVRQAIEELDNA